MGKITLRGPVPPEDPMFNGGVEFFRKADAFAELPRQPVTFVRRVTIKWAGEELQIDLSEDSCPLRGNSSGPHRWLFRLKVSILQLR